VTSIRNTDDVVLDAVRGCVLAVGLRRTTLTDVARRAGVSRMTLYRRYPDVDALVRDLMTREFGAVLREARESSLRDDAPASGERRSPAEARRSRHARTRHARGRLVATVVAAVNRLRSNELFRRVVDVDPDLLLPYVTHRLGSTQGMAAEFLADGLVAGQADGSVRAGDVHQLAYAALLLIQPFVYSARLVDHILDDAALDRELARALDRYLAP
jgi:AcrR family transcriptional regulator